METNSGKEQKMNSNNRIVEKQRKKIDSGMALKCNGHLSETLQMTLNDDERTFIDRVSIWLNLKIFKGALIQSIFFPGQGYDLNRDRENTIWTKDRRYFN